jgi:hypothetical protein
MARDNSLIALRTFSQALVIDAAYVRAADGRRLHAEQNLSMTWRRNRNCTEFDCAVSRQEGRLHRLLHLVFLLIPRGHRIAARRAAL